MKLQLLVPQYKEKDDIIKPLLDSLAIQQNISMDDVGVIIVNDGSDVHLTKEFLDSYPFDIQYILNPHKGVSATRNACFDLATAEYVMFCDADDMFYKVDGLYMIFQEMENGFDSVTSAFVEEGRVPDETKKPFYHIREMDSTFVHGKVHRRQYLIDQNIRFKDDLTIHEDSYFNILAQNCSEEVKYCPIPFYLWKWRDESVCRSDEKYILKTFRNMIDTIDSLVEQFDNRDMSDKADNHIGQIVFDAYYTLCKPEWIDDENKEFRDATEIHFAKFYVKYKDRYEKLPDPVKMMFSQGIRGRQILEGMQMENITLDDWLKKLEDLAR